MGPVLYHLQVLDSCVAEMNSAVPLGLQPEHCLGLRLVELSMAQLDVLEDFHYRQLEQIGTFRLRLHRQLRAEAQAEALLLDEDIRLQLSLHSA